MAKKKAVESRELQIGWGLKMSNGKIKEGTGGRLHVYTARHEAQTARDVLKLMSIECAVDRVAIIGRGA